MGISTNVATSPEVGNQAELDQLLGDDPVEETTAQDTKAEDSSVVTEEPEETTEEQPTDEGGEETTSDEEESEQAEEAEEEETELSIDETERDYSQAAYEKAARIFSKNLKLAVPIDPNDPVQRALLKERMQAGEALNRFKQEKAEAEAVKETAEEVAPKTEEAAAVPSKPTPEQIQHYIDSAATIAKARIIPEVAKRVATRFASALWPNEAKAGELPEMSQEQANDFTQALSEFFWMQLEDALPAIQQASRGYLSADPIFGQVEANTITATAFERMDGMKDKATGKPAFPDLEEMVESGTLRKVMAENPDIGKLTAGNGRDPIANQMLRLQTAYKIARGGTVNLQTVQTAVKTGEKKAVDRARKIASGRVSSGKPGGGFDKGPTDTQKIVSDIVAGTGSKFGAAVAAHRKASR